MAIPVPKGNNAEEGAYAAVIAGMWYVGNQLKEYEGIKSVKPCVCIAVELDGDMAGWIGENGDKQHVLFDEISIPMFWPGKRNSNLYGYATAAIGSTEADGMEDFESLVGYGVQVGVKHSNGKARIRTVSALMKGTPTPRILGNHAEPWGLAKYLLDKSVTDSEAAELKKQYADEADRRHAEKEAEEAAAFNAPPPAGSDDIEPQDIPQSDAGLPADEDIPF